MTWFAQAVALVYIGGALLGFGVSTRDFFRVLFGMLRIDEQLRVLRGHRTKRDFQRALRAGAYDHVSLVAEFRALQAASYRSFFLTLAWVTIGGFAAHAISALVD
jgi:hypothetical protein